MHAALPSFAMVLDTVVKSTVLLALAWSAALILKKRSAATQHMVRAFALAALLLLPFSVLLLPAWHVKGIPEFVRLRPQASRQTVAQPAATAISFASSRLMGCGNCHWSISSRTILRSSRTKQSTYLLRRRIRTQLGIETRSSHIQKFLLVKRHTGYAGCSMS